MSSDIAIQVENVSKYYHIYDRPQDRLKQSLWRGRKHFFHEFKALENISFEVKKGETVGIIGRNGSGKSTLLQIICGTLAATEGDVKVNGRIGALLELGVGFNPEFSGRENVYMNASILGLSIKEIDAKFDQIAAFADIGEFIEQPIKIYSSGMMVRLAFAVQAMVDPDVLIVDEALAVGDEKFQRKCFAQLEYLKNKGTSILFVSHSSSHIVEFCDRAIFLEHGKRIMFGKPHDVVRAYQKVIYASPEEQLRLIQQYSNEDNPGGEESKNTKLELESSEQNSNSDEYDANLSPDSTERYPIQGAEILSVQIRNAENRVVNILQVGHEYVFRLSGKFLSDSKDVYFGIHIRTITGTVVTGQLYPEKGNTVDRLNAGSEFSVEFGFKMNLLPDVYFIGAGIWSTGDPSCLHRILDLAMFRVSPQGKTISYGLIDGCSNEPIFKLY